MHAAQHEQADGFYRSMSFVLQAVWIGAFVGCLLKLGSPHRNPLSWIVASLVGAAGAVLGLFVARIGGYGAERATASLVVAALVSGATVVLYAIVSRRLYAAARRTGRLTRPTIVF